MRWFFLSIALWLGTLASADCPSEIDPSRSPHCQYWNNEVYLDLELVGMRSLDQLIPGRGGPKGYDLAGIERSVSPRCRVDAIARNKFPEKAILAELKCQHFEYKMNTFADCTAKNGIIVSKPPENWDETSWSGAAAWNEAFSALSDADRCLRLKQALAQAIEQVSSERPTFDSHGFGDQGDHSLFIHLPQPGHYHDRKAAAWALRYIHYTDWKLVPGRCQGTKQEGDFRFIEAENRWKENFPQIFGAPVDPEPFGRQALGYAFGMCGRCNNAHYTDSAMRILEYNKTQKDPSKRIYIAPDLRKFLMTLSYRDGMTTDENRGPWNGDIDWMGFLGVPPSKGKP